MLASNNVSFRLKKQPKYLEWLVLKRHTHPGAKQFTAAQIDTEKVKTYRRPTERTECSQRKTSTKVKESVPQLPVESEFECLNAANRSISRQLRSSPPVHHSIHPPCIARPLEPCDGAARRWIQSLVSIKN